MLSGVYSLVLIDEGIPQPSPALKKFARVAAATNSNTLPKFVQCRNAKCAQIKILTVGWGNLAEHNCKDTGPNPRHYHSYNSSHTFSENFRCIYREIQSKEENM